MKTSRTEPQILERVGPNEQLMLTVNKGELRVVRLSRSRGNADADCIAAMGSAVQLRALRDRLTALLAERAAGGRGDIGG